MFNGPGKRPARGHESSTRRTLRRGEGVGHSLVQGESKANCRGVMKRKRPSVLTSRDVAIEGRHVSAPSWWQRRQPRAARACMPLSRATGFPPHSHLRARGCPGRRLVAPRRTGGRARRDRLLIRKAHAAVPSADDSLQHLRGLGARFAARLGFLVSVQRGQTNIAQGGAQHVAQGLPLARGAGGAEEANAG